MIIFKIMVGIKTNKEDEEEDRNEKKQTQVPKWRLVTKENYLV